MLKYLYLSVIWVVFKGCFLLKVRHAAARRSFLLRAQKKQNQRQICRNIFEAQSDPVGVKYRDVLHSKAPLSPDFQKLSYLLGVDENSLCSNTRPLYPNK